MMNFSFIQEKEYILLQTEGKYDAECLPWLWKIVKDYRNHHPWFKALTEHINMSIWQHIYVNK